MADLTGITSVKPSATSTETKVRYGATVAVGDPLYLDSVTNKYKPADANVSAATADVKGIAMTPGADGEYGYMASRGSITLDGTTMSVGEPYVVSANVGEIAPETDLTTGDYVSRLGTAATATQLDLSLNSTGVQHA